MLGGRALCGKLTALAEGVQETQWLLTSVKEISPKARNWCMCQPALLHDQKVHPIALNMLHGPALAHTISGEQACVTLVMFLRCCKESSAM